MFANRKRKRFERLFQPHLNAAYNLARYLCGNAYDAEDIVQEAYLRAYSAFDEYCDGNSRAWILTITRNASRSWMRRHYRNYSIPLDEESNSVDVNALLSNASSTQSPERHAENGCKQRLVRRAIESLPIEFREVAVLRELEGLSYHEIGLVLGIPKGTVMSRIARARNRLRDLLADVNVQERQ